MIFSPSTGAPTEKYLRTSPVSMSVAVSCPVTTAASSVDVCAVVNVAPGSSFVPFTVIVKLFVAVALSASITS